MPDPIMVFELRDIFSVNNDTLLFQCDECKQKLLQIGAAINSKQLYASLEFNALVISLNQVSD